jgi:hypothetical protein
MYDPIIIMESNDDSMKKRSGPKYLALLYIISLTVMILTIFIRNIKAFLWIFPKGTSEIRYYVTGMDV